jgi:UDP-N-acetylmuramyl pentapeptide phosphotransferase/UDP-N-acetylglucosamine-1-phosphate transferase
MGGADVAPDWALAGLAVVVVTALLTAVLLLPLRPLLFHHALVRPDPRSSHTVPTPQGGGLAAIAAILLVGAFVAFNLDDPALPMALSAAALLAIVGIVDDVRAVPVGPRIFLQLIAVCIVIAALPESVRLVPSLPWPVERAGLLLAALWFINLFNFMDGLDWITVGAALPMSVGLVAIGFLDGLPPAAMFLAFALIGALLGFAPFNRPVAKLFLGDSGSLPIGLLLAWLLLLVAGNGHIAAALLLPLYYVADTTVTLCHRLWNGHPVFRPHRTHFYQVALTRKFSVLEIVTHVFSVNAALALLAIATVSFPSRTADVIALACGAALVVWLLVRFARGR